MRTPEVPDSARTASHRALLHDGPDELAQRVAPELAAALDRGDAVYASLTAEEWEALDAAIGPSAGAVTQLPAPDRYSNPGVAMAALYGFIQQSLGLGAREVWSVGSIQLEGDPALDARWARYETAADHVLAGLPFHGICAYDRTRAPEPIIEMLRRCHRHADLPRRGVQPCVDHQPYEHAAAPWPHRVVTPRLELRDVAPVSLRATLTELCASVLPDDRLGDLHLVATELVTNGMRHGEPPVDVRVWVGDEGVVIEVWDSGPGIDHPFAALRPHRGGVAGGHGLWLVGQLSDQVSIGREDDRTVVVASLRSSR